MANQPAGVPDTVVNCMNGKYFRSLHRRLFYTPQDGAEEGLEAVLVGRGSQDAALVEHGLRGASNCAGARLLRSIGAEPATSGLQKCADDGVVLFRLARTGRINRAVRPVGPLRRRCESSSAACRAERARSASAGASGCRDRGAPCRDRSTAHRRTRCRTPPRTAGPLRDRPADHADVAWRRWRATVSRSSSARALRTSAATISRPIAGHRRHRGRLAARRRAGVEHAHAGFGRRRAATRAARLRPAAKNRPVPASGVRKRIS